MICADCRPIVADLICGRCEKILDQLGRDPLSYDWRAKGDRVHAFAWRRSVCGYHRL